MTVTGKRIAMFFVLLAPLGATALGVLTVYVWDPPVVVGMGFSDFLETDPIAARASENIFRLWAIYACVLLAATWCFALLRVRRRTSSDWILRMRMLALSLWAWGWAAGAALFVLLLIHHGYAGRDSSADIPRPHWMSDVLAYSIPVAWLSAAVLEAASRWGPQERTFRAAERERENLVRIARRGVS